MTAVRQDFTIYSGDGSVPIFTVIDDAGNAIDISGVSNIFFNVRRSLADPVILTKNKAAGQITFVTTGTDGKFQVALGASDTTPLSGYYLYQCVLIDSLGSPSTVTIGRLQVGAAPAWTYSGDPTLSTKDGVRWLIGDTIAGDPLIYDPEILFAVQQRSSVYGAAALCCRNLATKFSRQADTVQGDLHVLYSSRARSYAERAKEFDQLALGRSGAVPFAGGISVAQKEQQQEDTDRVLPNFNLGMQDNWLPVGPAGNENSTSAPNPSSP